MKVEVTQANLNKALSIVGRVAGGRTSLPILSNVLLSVEDNQLKLAATNLEVAITQHIGAKVSEPGSITVPARLMSDFINSLPDSNIQLSVEENKLSIKAKGYSSTINGVSSEEFPSIPIVSAKNPLVITGKNLKGVIAQTIVAASSDEARPVLTGVFTYVHEGSLLAVATDSYRLAEKVIQVKTNLNELSVIVPAKTFAEIQRIVSDEDSVQLHFDDVQMLVEVGDVQIVSKLIDGKFPAYKQLIPEKSDVSFKIERKELLNATKVAALFARESAGSITLEVSEDDNSVSIASVASQVGNNNSTLSTTVKGSGSVTLNSRYLIDALNAINDQELTFRFSGSTNPCILEPTGEEKQNYLHVVMPLRS
ncbi:TPA: DNA polymerase III subunit beta [Candidatus Saccharibacteria bacterium]|nr:DNA polymerase III subunit beta [Candidatus Saccharibacteria bacterium]HIO87837.1 DNA polymerase III subunit beta [Candidatus Saccharibacteria bacterium]